jgi:hypothetical protein
LGGFGAHFSRVKVEQDKRRVRCARLRQLRFSFDRLTRGAGRGGKKNCAISVEAMTMEF